MSFVGYPSTHARFSEPDPVSDPQPVVGTPPTLSFDDEFSGIGGGHPSADETFAEEERRRRERFDEIGGGYGGGGAGQISRGNDGVYRGWDNPAPQPYLTMGDLYGASGGVGGTPSDWYRRSPFASNQPQQFQQQSYTSGGGGGWPTFSGGGGSSGTVTAPTAALPTTARDAVANPLTLAGAAPTYQSPGAAPVYTPPTPYTPRAPEREIYDQLKGLLQNPDSFTSDSLYQILVQQGEKALGRRQGAQGRRFSGGGNIDFQQHGQNTAAQYYDKRLNQLFSGTDKEQTRNVSTEGAERNAYGMNVDSGYRGYQSQADAWKGAVNNAQYGHRGALDAWGRVLGSATQTYGTQMNSALLQDRNQQAQNQWTLNQNPGITPGTSYSQYAGSAGGQNSWTPQLSYQNNQNLMSPEQFRSLQSAWG